MKSHNNKEWEKLAVEKSEITTENDHLATKLLNQKRAEKKRDATLQDLVKRGIFNSNFRKPYRISQN